MIPFRVNFRPGSPLYEQVIYAAKKAMISGHMRPGDPFPSVRALSRELKINPNTAHKVITHLIAAGLLEARSSVGTVVAALPDSSMAQRTALLGREIEELTVEAKALGIDLEDMVASITQHWKQLSSRNPGEDQADRRGGRKR